MKKMSVSTALNVQQWTNIITCVLLMMPLLSTYLSVFGLSEATMLIVSGTIAFISGCLSIIMKVFFTEKPLAVKK